MPLDFEQLRSQGFRHAIELAYGGGDNASDAALAAAFQPFNGLLSDATNTTDQWLSQQPLDNQTVIDTLDRLYAVASGIATAAGLISETVAANPGSIETTVDATLGVIRRRVWS